MQKSEQTSKITQTIFHISRLIKGITTSRSEINHLSILQVQALFFLKNNSNAQMSEIAQHFKIELPTATSLVNKLCTMDLAERNSDKNDRRLVRISLTESGKKILDSAMKERTQKIEKILDYLTDSDKNDLMRIMETLLTRLEKEYEG